MAAKLWAASRAHHDDVRRTPFIVALTGRWLPWKAYADWLAQLYLLHESLAQVEDVLAEDASGPASRSGCVSLPALSVDLRFLHGPNWQRHIVACPATTVYCAHLRDLVAGDAVGLLAHHYARHFEDLHAGTTLAPVVATTYGLDDAGRRFLTPNDADHWRYADKSHRLLHGLPLTSADHALLLDSVIQVHRMYLGVITDLGRSWA
jgi:heme oxygenase